MSLSYEDVWDKNADYKRRYERTMYLIKSGQIEKDDYKCICGRINVFGGEGYVDPKTEVFWCGYCT